MGFNQEFNKIKRWQERMKVAMEKEQGVHENKHKRVKRISHNIDQKD